MEIISFEGVGGSGKSTLSERVFKLLGKKGKKCQLIKGLKRTDIEAALCAYSGPREQAWVCNIPYVPPAVETLALLGLAMALQEKIDKSSKYVIFDRYIDSIFAQVYARNNMKGRKLKAGPFYKWFSKVVSSVGIALPVKTFILDLPLEIASKRTVGREGKKYTKNDFGGFLKIREIYSFLQKREPKRIIWLDGCKRPEELTNEVMSWINK